MSQTTDTPELIAPDELIARLPGSFERGLESGDLFFYESTTADLSEGGIDVCFFEPVCDESSLKIHMRSLG